MVVVAKAGAPDVVHEHVHRVGDVVEARQLSEPQHRHPHEALQPLEAHQGVVVVNLRHRVRLVFLEVRR
eukprot:3757202-Pyramimonas_sp.AAC.1